MRLIFIIICLAYISISAQNSVLDTYVETALKNNLALKQKSFSYFKSIAALNEARGLFLPSVDINARYSRAGGGRTFDIPVGDILNPVHQGLNTLLGVNAYPTNVPNQNINFFREKEQETKISLIQPLFKPEILYNYNIQSNLCSVKKYERDSYARELVREIKSAYFSYLKTIKVLDLYAEAEILMEENLRVSNSLYTNDKVTKDVVYRAEAELSEIRQQKADAEKNNDLSRAYLNFLLNEPLETEIMVDESIDLQLEIIKTDDFQFNSALKNREEFKQIDAAINATSSSIALSDAGNYPGLILAVDYGFQGEQYKFTKDDDFWMASLVLQWNLFKGFQDQAKAEQSEWEKKKLESKKLETKRQIMLQVREAIQEVRVTRKAIKTAAQRKISAAKSFEIMNKKFKNGMASQIEFIDARTSYTRSSINEVITQYDYMINLANLERAAASYDLNYSRLDRTE